ncbi:peptidoglycan editing factor PgeF [Salinisphaera sp. T31B1]|uniref:peptidoglycan editing factor PgeF n=1 Tax=Salinisphaera sp. T31B1 TaxID=727963 RepID=UPI0033429522
MSDTIGFLAADWPAPAGIGAGTTLRRGGVSAPPFDTFNLGDRAGDDPAAVAVNRQRLRQALGLPGEPSWLQQVHGAGVVEAGQQAVPEADASVASHGEAVCVVLTADCLPVLLCDRDGRCFGAAHAGWRGLAAGVLEATVARLPSPPDQIMAWLGPAIGAHNFEVGEDVRQAFCRTCVDDASAFVPAAQVGKYRADIYALARNRLARAGLAGDSVYGGGLCTIDDQARFYSYRRSSTTGRMASLVWRSR